MFKNEVNFFFAEKFEAACQMNEDKVIHPFAYRTHAHKLAIVNSGYLVSKDEKTGKQKWTEIGRRSPQLPQMFFPASNDVAVKKGDVLAARCTMYNFRDHLVRIGYLINYLLTIILTP